MENDAGRGSPEANVSSSRSALPVVPQGLGVPVEEYLARADTKKLLASSTLTKIPSSSGSIKNNVVAVGSPAPESVQVVGEPKSSKYVSELHRLCQTTQGLVPLFEIECDGQGATWGGKLVVGDRTISRGEMRWQSKKAAREGLAELGVGIVKGMVKGENGKGKNWIGMLQDYHTASMSRPIYNEQTLVDSSFACTCTIPARPSSPFGSLLTPFPNKKAARTNAAREAMQFLISQDLAALLNNNNNNNNASSSSPSFSSSSFSSPSFSSSSFSSPSFSSSSFSPSSFSSSSFSSSSSANDVAQIKKMETGGSVGEMNRKIVSAKEADDFLANDASYTLKVLKLCSLLQLPQPTYRLAPNPLAPLPNILSGAAYFTQSSVSDSHPLLVGPVGEVRNVYGKKNAKEECARGVFQVLMKIITTSGERDLLGGG